MEGKSEYTYCTKIQTEDHESVVVTPILMQLKAALYWGELFAWQDNMQIVIWTSYVILRF